MKSKEMRFSQTLVCVKQVKQEAVEEWDDSMPLPGDIIEGIAASNGCTLEGVEEKSFVPTKVKSELRSQLAKISKRNAKGFVWLKVRRGNQMVNLRVCVVQEKRFRLNRKYSFCAASNDKHIAVLDDLDVDQCTELQDMSRRAVNVVSRGFNQETIRYNWRRKVANYLPDHRSTVVSSILFMPLSDEYDIDSITTRAMAWFTATVSSGIPIVFVNIQTEQIISLDGCHSTRIPTHGIRLWFLPGISEISFELIPEYGENRFGLDVKRTDEVLVSSHSVTCYCPLVAINHHSDYLLLHLSADAFLLNFNQPLLLLIARVLLLQPAGFVCIYAVTKDSAADRAGLRQLFENSIETGHLVVLSRLEAKSVIPTMVSSDGLIHCCDHGDIRETLVGAVNQQECIGLHIMSWPMAQNHGVGVAATLRPPM
ncbi:uncharacterized protein [Rutidosis leptorrhynchoides]|uniref:uncharacterized protein n=1 Tax=Rutidosis leptorrhynchoides TaxID=125765 RepID=UPI003A991A0D